MLDCDLVHAPPYPLPLLSFSKDDVGSLCGGGRSSSESVTADLAHAQPNQVSHNGLSSKSPLRLFVRVSGGLTFSSHVHLPFYTFSLTHTSRAVRSYGRGPSRVAPWVYRCTGNAMQTTPIQRPWVHKGGSFQGYESPGLTPRRRIYPDPHDTTHTSPPPLWTPF